MTRDRAHQRGVALVVVAIFMVVIMGFTALGVDIARLAHIATEVQSVADAAARGGASALMTSNSQNGDGITGAHRISGHNGMNGALAANADVKVDEGFWNTINHRFQCCGTANTPCCSGKGTSPYNKICEAPTRDCQTKHTAVLAMPHTVVDNIFAGVLDYVSGGTFASAAQPGEDHGHTKVEKLAIALAAGPRDACRNPGCTQGDWKCYCEHGVAPCLPIAAPSCQYQCSATSCVLPTLTVSSGSDSAAWTGFSDGANSNNVRTYLSSNTTSGAACGSGNGKAVPVQEVGSTINVTNGIAGSGTTTPFSMVQCLIGQQPQKNKNSPPPPPPQGCTIDSNGKITGWGGTVFSLPIFDLDTCTTSMNQSWPLVGFATVQITNVNLTGSPNSITLQTVKNTTTSGASPGGECFQTDCRVTMTR